ncbi:hypothetical protein [Micromonospora parathelypteridis]|uniref:Uncharacterized protein n=1 Tax=Micromonospora parathelypteridis TaxID=1839617 RepID=A0A840VKV4_9ACTN|nr:hypothetical protein [Micromonospora parathelypteridis]MBB5477583.1 hypothetical protein [Micromonospora parathelypteridis]GGO10592.1 hypothetical protein GCM10011576_18210 [Micromonospora parathelypteridis]
MVYRYESDEDAFEEYPGPGSDLSVLGAGPPPPAGPSPSRFPTPSLPRANQLSLPSSQPPPARADIPPAAPRSQVYTSATPIDPAARRGGGRLWQVLIGGAAVLVLLALCGLGAAALLIDRNEQPQNTPTYQPNAAAPTSAAPERPALDSRESDQAPLTAKELFPTKELKLTSGQPSYQVLKTQSSGSCAVAATDEVADLLVLLGCNQVVRGTLRTPDGDHLVTAGLFNLTDKVSADRARDRVRQLLDERQGRFRGLVAGTDDGTDMLTTAPARVGWQVRGHYLAYALVVREDGAAIKAGDTKVREILYDMIELHLSRGVLQQRADGGTASQPTPASSDGSASQGGSTDDGGLPGD